MFFFTVSLFNLLHIIWSPRMWPDVLKTDTFSVGCCKILHSKMPVCNLKLENSLVFGVCFFFKWILWVFFFFFFVRTWNFARLRINVTKTSDLTLTLNYIRTGIDICSAFAYILQKTTRLKIACLAFMNR